MKVNEIRFGDVITYRNGIKNNVNKPYKYHQFYNNDFKNISLYSGFDIMKIQRYIKVLGLYVLKTVYKRY